MGDTEDAGIVFDHFFSLSLSRVCSCWQLAQLVIYAVITLGVLNFDCVNFEIVLENHSCLMWFISG